jgi:hypothetical protein
MWYAGENGFVKLLTQEAKPFGKDTCISNSGESVVAGSGDRGVGIEAAEPINMKGTA